MFSVLSLRWKWEKQPDRAPNQMFAVDDPVSVDEDGTTSAREVDHGELDVRRRSGNGGVCLGVEEEVSCQMQDR